MLFTVLSSYSFKMVFSLCRFHKIGRRLVLLDNTEKEGTCHGHFASGTFALSRSFPDGHSTGYESKRPERGPSLSGARPQGRARFRWRPQPLKKGMSWYFWGLSNCIFKTLLICPTPGLQKAMEYASPFSPLTPAECSDLQRSCVKLLHYLGTAYVEVVFPVVITQGDLLSSANC